MGNTIAKNAATQSVTNSIGVNTTQVANCATLVNGAQNLTFTASGPGSVCNVDYSTIQEIAAYQIDASCFANQSIQSSVNSQISESAAQQAQAIGQNLDLNPGTTSASNLVNQITSSAIQVSSVNYSACLQSVTESQTIGCNATNGGTVNLSHVYIGLEDITNAINQCVFNQASSTDITNVISAISNQSAKAVVQNALGWILMAIAIIILVFFFISFEFLEWALIILLIVGVLIGIYLIIARIRYWWPFTRPAPSVDRKSVV